MTDQAPHQADDGWQPIEDAPTGEIIQLTDGVDVYAGSWVEGFRRGWAYIDGPIRYDAASHRLTASCNAWPEDQAPTHFRPLAAADFPITTDM